MKFKDIINEKIKEYKYLEISYPDKKNPEYIEYVKGLITKRIYYTASNGYLFKIKSKNPPDKSILNSWEKQEMEMKKNLELEKE